MAVIVTNILPNDRTDAEAVALVALAEQHTGIPPTKHVPPDDLAAWVIRRRHNASDIWEVRDNGMLIAHAIAEPVVHDGRDVVEFGLLAVHPDHQGQGHARMLLEAFLRQVTTPAITAAWTGSPSHAWLDRHPRLEHLHTTHDGDVQVYGINATQ